MPIVVQESFNGGEVSNPINSRLSLQKRESSLKKLTNGFVHIEGCVSNRAGTILDGETKYANRKCRVIPFCFNDTQQYIIELGHKYARFYNNYGLIVYPDDYSDSSLRGQPVEIVTPYKEADLFKIKYCQNADTITFTCRSYAAKELSRYSNYDWRLEDIVVAPQISAPTNLTGSWTGGSDNPRDYEYVVTAVNSDYEESVRSDKVTVTGEYEASWGVGEYISLSWTAVTGAVEYNIYRNVNGVFGFCGTSDTNSFRDNKIEPDINSSAPIFKDPFDEGGNAGCCTYFSQRKIFGGFDNYINRFVASQTGTSKNFNISRPLIASDAITINISEREMNEIKHLIGMDNLLVFTSSGVYKSSSSDKTFSASDLPETVIQCFYGASDVQPVVCGRMVLFVQNGGEIIRDLGYTYVSDSYDSANLIIFARHLFKNKTVVSMAFCDEPYHTLYCVMSDGTMNVLTYDKAQEVLGWAQYITQGQYEDVCKIKDGSRDVAVFVVKRKINGQTVRFIEHEANRDNSGVIGSVFSDCSLTYNGSVISTVSGLEHLANETVSVNADGEVYSLKVSAQGSITLRTPASNIVVGLPYTFNLKTLNIEGNGTKGLKKVIKSACVEIIDSREEFFTVGANGEKYQNERSYESVNDSNLLMNKVIDCYFDTDATTRATVEIIQDKPLPLCISGLETSIVIEENLLDVKGSQE